ncbi:hypothetical protein [Kribbella sp. C-35]
MSEPPAQYNIDEAKTQLSRILERVEPTRDRFIQKYDVPVLEA